LISQVQFHCIAAFEQPWSIRRGEQPTEQTVECRLPAQALEVETFVSRYPSQAVFQRNAKCSR